VENRVADALSRRVHSSEDGITLAVTELNPKCVELVNWLGAVGSRFDLVKSGVESEKELDRK
jgi:hypothetical protein